MKCESLYMSDTRGTRIAAVLLWVFILVVLFGLVAEQLNQQGSRGLLP